MLDSVLSYNVVGAIKGNEFPDEIIVVGGHLDSWDLGKGAHDDGAGVVQSIEVLRTFKSLGIKPKRTIHAVAFMNEENGLMGGKKYAELAEKNKDKNIVALESDAGGFPPLGFGLNMTDDKKKKIQVWKPLFLPYNLWNFEGEGDGADISPMTRKGLPGIGLHVESQRYFEIHHAKTDVIENVNKGYLQIFGNIRKDTKNLEGAEIKVMKNNAAVQTLYTTANGKFVFNLPLNGEYTVSIGKPGLLGKSISVSTVVPDDQKDIIFSYKFNVDLIPAVGDAAQAEALSKPIAKIAYSQTYEDFDYDQEYTKQAKAQVDQVVKDAAVKARADSMAMAEATKKRKQEEELAKQKADVEAKARAKAKADSMAFAEKLKAEAAGRARIEAEKKHKADSTAAAQVEIKRKQDEEQARLKAEAEAKVKAKVQADSVALAGKLKAEAAERVRLEAEKKHKADSTAAAQAEIKRKQDEDQARVKAEAEAQAKAKAQTEAGERAKIEAVKKRKAESTSTAQAEVKRKQQS